MNHSCWKALLSSVICPILSFPGWYLGLKVVDSKTSVQLPIIERLIFKNGKILLDKALVSASEATMLSRSNTWLFTTKYPIHRDVKITSTELDNWINVLLGVRPEQDYSKISLSIAICSSWCIGIYKYIHQCCSLLNPILCSVWEWQNKWKDVCYNLCPQKYTWFSIWKNGADTHVIQFMPFCRDLQCYRHDCHVIHEDNDDNDTERIPWKSDPWDVCCLRLWSHFWQLRTTII